mmetsp:Transcript_41489/g.96951  ORF Transcript_41489/g.96951 Transcript_41489/m.96951 type:complete len:302 (+) Transcript_41489:2730-3635(+)
MPGDVLKGLLILLVDLGTLPQCELAVGRSGQVTAFLVLFTTDADLHEHGGFRTGQMAQKTHVDRSPQVVAVGNEHILVAFPKKLIQSSREEQSGIDVSVSGWAPFTVGLLRVLGRRHGLSDFWSHVLLQGNSLPLGMESRILLHEILRVCLSGERIEEHKAYRLLLLDLHNLLHDEVHESFFILHLKQTLGFIQAHAGAETTVEAHHHRLSQRCGTGRQDLCQAFGIRCWQNLALAHDPLASTAQSLVKVHPPFDEGRTHSFLDHLRSELIGMEEESKLSCSCRNGITAMKAVSCWVHSEK